MERATPVGSSWVGGDADVPHACGGSCFRTGVRVLEDDALVGRRAEPCGGAQVDFGAGFWDGLLRVY